VNSYHHLWCFGSYCNFEVDATVQSPTSEFDNMEEVAEMSIVDVVEGPVADEIDWVEDSVLPSASSVCRGADCRFQSTGQTAASMMPG
jgi:hypothetical protein